MSKKDDNFQASRDVILSFLMGTVPFDGLPQSNLEQLAQTASTAFYPKSTLLLEQDESVVSHLYLIQKGGVRVFLKGADDSETLVDYRGEGSSFGAWSMIRDCKAYLNVQSVEDTFCYLFPRHSFLDLINKNPGFAAHYLKSLSHRLVGPAYSELLAKNLSERSQEGIFLFTSKIAAVAKSAPQSVPMGTTIQQVAAKMSGLSIGSLLVTDESGDMKGIITDKDLTAKVVAKGMSLDDPVEMFMSSPIKTVSSNSLCFDAVMEMLTGGVHHLAVETDERITGVITAHDILAAQGSSPLFLMREIDAQQSIEGLYSFSDKTVSVIRRLIEEGAKADNVARVMAVLNDGIINKILTLMVEELGPPPVPFCWIVMGSEGRKEQTFRTDQDNAIIYENPDEDWEKIKTTKLYFRNLGNQAIKHLTACGYPLCKGEMMASFSRWRKPFSVWVEYFDQWMSTTDLMETLNAKIFFDFRPVFGDFEIGARLRKHITQRAQKNESFLKNLAKDCLAIEPPISFFRNFIVERNGEHKNRLDLKLKGLTPIVDFARMMALKYGKTETNTLGRLAELQQDGLISLDVYSDLVEAYNFLMHLRLVGQLRLIERGAEPHNFVNPGELTDLQKITLKEAFAVIKRTQNYAARIRAEM